MSAAVVGTYLRPSAAFCRLPDLANRLARFTAPSGGRPRLSPPPTDTLQTVSWTRLLSVQTPEGIGDEGTNLAPVMAAIAPADRVQPMRDRPVELGAQSPELALVDPELAAAARAALADRPWEAFVSLPVEIFDLEAGRRYARVPARHAFRSGRLASIAAAVLAASGVALLTAATPGGGVDLRQPDERSAVPAPSPRSQPVAQTFSWVPAPNASAYEFQLFRGAERVFRARVEQPRLELPRRWRERDRAHTLEPGNYVWYVWSVSRRTKQQATAAIVRARLVVG
jgi:hypothetical protein